MCEREGHLHESEPSRPGELRVLAEISYGGRQGVVASVIDSNFCCGRYRGYGKHVHLQCPLVHAYDGYQCFIVSTFKPIAGSDLQRY